MLTRAEAEAAAKKAGLRFYVKNSAGGLHGIFRTRKDAGECRKREQAALQKSPWPENRTLKVFVEEVSR